MAHDAQLSIYKVKIKPINNSVEGTFRNLFKLLTNNIGEVQDGFLILEIFKRFISTIDTDQMYSDENSLKSMTAYQADIEQQHVNANLRIHTASYIIEGVVEGGKYGKIRKKTSITNKANRVEVSPTDAITDSFFFLIHMPPESDKAVLMIQSYSDDNINSVMKKFWKDFFTLPNYFNSPTFYKFIPPGIIQDFKNGATISSLTYSTEIPSNTLLDNPINININHFKVTIKIEPVDEGFTYDEFNQIIGPIEDVAFKEQRLSGFLRKKGSLMANQGNKTSPFTIGNDFEIKPIILLSRYIDFTGHQPNDFNSIKEYCINLLNDIKPEIYPQHAIQER